MYIDPIRIAASEIIGYGTVGTILDSALIILEEVDPNLADMLEVISNQVRTKWKTAEKMLMEAVEAQSG